jgi:hypothetical protein
LLKRRSSSTFPLNYYPRVSRILARFALSVDSSSWRTHKRLWHILGINCSLMFFAICQIQRWTASFDSETAFIPLQAISASIYCLFPQALVTILLRRLRLYYLCH